MPISTTLVSRSGAASACPARTCPTISAVPRLRTSPMRAVAQNPQPMPQPAWLEMQRVRRSRAPSGRSTWGIRTLSIAAGARAGSDPAGSWNRSLRVPSLARATVAGSSRPTSNSSASRRRSSFGRFAISSKRVAPCRWIQASTWRAR